MLFCLGTYVSNTVINLSTNYSAMCCCLVHSVCRLSQCQTKSYYVFPSALYALGHDLSLLNFFIQVTDASEYRFWCELCPVSSANPYHQRAQETVLFWHEEKHGCSPALPAVCFPCTFRVAVFSGTEMLAGFLANCSSPCQRPQDSHLRMFSPPKPPSPPPFALRTWKYFKAVLIT